MTQHYSRSGSTFTPVDAGAINIQERLPIGTYTILVSPKGYYLEQVEDFCIKGKVYGNVDTDVKRILNTFNDREKSTGVLLAGPKGTGKTMLTKRICEEAYKVGMVVIVINQPLHGEDFNSLIQKIDQPAVILFDEYEKVYNKEKQPSLLTLFDGVYPMKKLFLLTCNDSHQIDKHMHNRPGRIYYSIDFKGLDVAFIEEYCADKLENMDLLPGILTVSGFFSDFSFDMLQALVEEMNRYGETATQALAVLNIKPNSDIGTYDISILQNGAPLLYGSKDDDHVTMSPLSLNEWPLYLSPRHDFEENPPLPNEIDEHTTLTISGTNISSVNPKEGRFTFTTEHPGIVVVFTRRSYSTKYFNYG